MLLKWKALSRIINRNNKKISSWKDANFSTYVFYVARGVYKAISVTLKA